MNEVRVVPRIDSLYVCRFAPMPALLEQAQAPRAK